MARVKNTLPLCPMMKLQLILTKTTDPDDYGVDQSDIIELDDNFDVAESLEFFNFSFISDPAQVDGNDSNVPSINRSESSTGIVNNHLTDNLLTRSTTDQNI